jgi:alcohol dehydrogenase class IV
MIDPFRNHLPVRIRFGDGVAGELGTVVAAHGARRVLVLVDEGLEDRSSAVAKAIAGLRDAEVTRFVKPGGEPTIRIVDAATEAIAAASADVIVAIGGGSVIDTAKAARLCAQLGESFAAFLASDRRVPEPTVPLVAMPTTAGTGSEVSGGSVITDHEQGVKAPIADPLLRAQHALVDPLLTHSVPPATTAYTGIDALAQAIAGVIARGHTPIGDAIGLEAVRLIAGSLVRAHRAGDDAAARAAMACGSLMAGLTMNISDCAAEHSLGQAISGLLEVPHGVTIGVVLAETLDVERDHVPERLERVADALGAPDDGSRDGTRAVRAVRDLLAELQFPVLRSIGVAEEQLEPLTELTLADPFIAQAPHAWTSGEVRATFEAALALGERARATR